MFNFFFRQFIYYYGLLLKKKIFLQKYNTIYQIKNLFFYFYYLKILNLNHI